MHLSSRCFSRLLGLLQHGRSEYKLTAIHLSFGRIVRHIVDGRKDLGGRRSETDVVVTPYSGCNNRIVLI